MKRRPPAVKMREMNAKMLLLAIVVLVAMNAGLPQGASTTCSGWRVLALRQLNSGLK